MADNAIDKLIEETRNAYAEVNRISAEISALDIQRQIARDGFAMAKKRCDMLDLTMTKHIHENMPVVQAKMIAHEEIEQIQAADRSASASRSHSASIQSASSAQSASLSSAQLALASTAGSAQAASAAANSQLANIAKCYAGRNNWSLNLSI
ncbi:hypothetical protein [Sphingobium limneticum]|uniref:Uncharacterized protein n=1 Tax=Sphingobium limneticum TaxID=1007511 RepID=A0A5J5HNS5_9SPHN|nr:hypothetical protein [Sphingobium limneticum]KAA9010938.1 hypothetical protein F4U96_24060 [Sphingobium limneticum]KAA9023025.1 hypothetical protein F4U95_23985 [Sphingobium limneticum]